MTPEEAESALTGFMFGQASRLLASARRGNARSSTWEEWEEEWQAMFRALRKTWQEASEPKTSGTTGPSDICGSDQDRHARGDCGCADTFFATWKCEEGQKGEEG